MFLSSLSSLSLSLSPPWDLLDFCDPSAKLPGTLRLDLSLNKGVEFHAEVQFQYLQILRVCGDIPPQVLTWLVAPALEELHIRANALHRTSIASLWYYSEPLCRHLYAHLPEAVSIEEPHWAEAFNVLVEKCTRLKTLHISKWMEEECQKFIGLCDIVLY